MPRLRSMIAVSLVALSVGACTRTDVPEETRRGPRVLGLRGHVFDTARAQPLDESAPLQTDARFDIKADSAVTLLLTNGCVVHVVGPTEVSLSTLSTLMAEPCTEPLDAQVALLGGIKGAMVMLRERTAAAGQDQTAFHDTPRRGGHEESTATPSKKDDSRSADEAPPHAIADKGAQLESFEIKPAPNVAPSAGAAPVGTREEVAGTTPKATAAGPPTDATVTGRSAPKEGSTAASANGVDSTTKTPEHQELAGTQDGTASGEVGRLSAASSPQLVGLLLRSHALEKLFDDPTHAVCRAALVKDGPVTIHARVQNGLIVEVTLANGNPVPCETSLLRQALPFANGVAVARLNPAP